MIISHGPAPPPLGRRGPGEDNDYSKAPSQIRKENQMDHAPIFELDFICPSCNSHTTIVERKMEYAEDEIRTLELLSWKEDNHGQFDVATDVEAETTRVNSYETGRDIKWFCYSCNYQLPVDTLPELFTWLHHNKMLIPE